jgi:hypothetical protein
MFSCFSYSDKDYEESGENGTENEIEKDKQVRCLLSYGVYD